MIEHVGDIRAAVGLIKAAGYRAGLMVNTHPDGSTTYTASAVDCPGGYWQVNAPTELQAITKLMEQLDFKDLE